MRTNFTEAAARRWSLRAALLLGLVALLAALATTVDAQNQPKPPHWFWGNDADAYAGGTIQAVDQDGVLLPVSAETDNVIVSTDGEWSYVISPEAASRVTFRIVTRAVILQTGPIPVIGDGTLTKVSITEFSLVTDDLQGDRETLTVRIIARRAPDGRIEFGMRPPVGDDIFPRQRFFPATGPDHNRWLRSSEIDFGDGFKGRIIARRVPDGRVEFGFRVEGHEDIFPRQRFFPATGPDHNRWLRSSEIVLYRPQ